MNNLSAINNAPTLVQTVARQVSATATLTSKVAFTALSYFVATLHAVPPLLPLMIVVIAGVTIAAIIVRHVLYPEASSSSQASQPNQSQRANSGSKAQEQSKKSNNRREETGPGIPAFRKGNRAGSSSIVRIPPRITKPISRSSGTSSESEVEIKAATEKTESMQRGFSYSVYPRRDSEENLEVANDLVRADSSKLLQELQKSSPETGSKDGPQNREQDPSSSAPDFGFPDVHPQQKSTEEVEVANDLLRADSSKLSKEVAKDDSKESDHKLAGVEDDQSISASNRSSFSVQSESAAYSTATGNKVSPGIARLIRSLSFKSGSRKEDQLASSPHVSLRRDSSTKSENGDRKSSRFSFSRLSFGSQSQKSSAAPTVSPFGGAATTDNIPAAPLPRESGELKEVFRRVVTKVIENNRDAAKAAEAAQQASKTEVQASLDQDITEEWLFGKDDKEAVDGKLEPVQEANETDSISSSEGTVEATG